MDIENHAAGNAQGSAQGYAPGTDRFASEFLALISPKQNGEASPAAIPEKVEASLPAIVRAFENWEREIRQHQHATNLQLQDAHRHITDVRHEITDNKRGISLLADQQVNDTARFKKHDEQIGTLIEQMTTLVVRQQALAAEIGPLQRRIDGKMVEIDKAIRRNKWMLIGAAAGIVVLVLDTGLRFLLPLAQ